MSVSTDREIIIGIFGFNLYIWRVMKVLIANIYLHLLLGGSR